MVSEEYENHIEGLRNELRRLCNEEYSLEDVLCQLEVVASERDEGANLIGKKANKCVAQILRECVDKCYPCD